MSVSDSKLDRWIRELLRLEGDPEREAPVEEMWARIESDVEAAARAHGLSAAAPGRRGRAGERARRTWLRGPVLAWAMAAGLVLAITTGTLVVLDLTRGPGETGGGVADAGSTPALAVAADYERAISDMEDAAARRGALSSGGLREALSAVDRAIRETRSALQRDPSDPYYQTHLIRNLELKLSILEGSLRL